MSRFRGPDRSIVPVLSAAGSAPLPALAPNVRRRRFDQTRLGRVVILSLGLHLALLLMFLLWPQPDNSVQGEPPGEVSIAIESAPGPRTTPNPGKDQIPQNTIPRPNTTVTNEPLPPTTVPDQQPDQTATAPAQPQSAPPSVQAPPVPPPPAPPQVAQTPATAPPAPPVVRPEVPPDEQAELPLPPPPVPIPQAPPPVAFAQPAPPAPPMPVRPAPRAPTSRPASRAPPPGEFPHPMDFAFNGSVADAHPHNATQPLHGLDLALGQSSRNRANSYTEFRGGHLSWAYEAALKAWWIEHRYYPEQALLNGEDGIVTVRITAGRDGRVRNVEIESRSGSQWIDMAAQATFRGAKLPPFPDDMPDQETTFSQELHYILIGK